MHEQEHEHSYENCPTVDVDELGDHDAIAVVHTGRQVDLFLTVRYCSKHKTYAVRVNDDDDEIVAGSNSQSEALALADLYIDGYIYGRNTSGLEVDRIVHWHLTPVHVIDLREREN